MKKMFLIWMVVGLVCFAAVAAWAQTKEETRLDKSAAAIDKDASTPGGEKAVVQRLEKRFKGVDEARITSLRSQKLGYGEIAIILAMAQKMPGGIIDANVNKIVSMRQGRPKQGWGEISKNLVGMKLGSVISPVEKVEKETHADIEKGARIEKGQRPERPERPEKMEKPERPERVGK